MFKRLNPEDTKNLEFLQPARRYTEAQVRVLMTELEGIANDGLLMAGWEIVGETERYYNVEISYAPFGVARPLYENWYFFKPDA
jgi:hypothetical protein